MTDQGQLTKSLHLRFMHGDVTSVTLGSENARVLEEEKQLVTCLIDQAAIGVRRSNSPERAPQVEP